MDGQYVTRCKKIYKVKYDSNDTYTRQKARLVAKVYAQNYGLDNKETFLPITKMSV